MVINIAILHHHTHILIDNIKIQTFIIIIIINIIILFVFLLRVSSCKDVVIFATNSNAVVIVIIKDFVFLF